MLENIKEKILAETSLSLGNDGLINICNHRPINLYKNFGSPLYIYSEKEIIKKIEALKRSFKDYEGIFEPHYSFKANNNVHVINTMKNNGLGAEVASINELKLALKLGFKNTKIIYHGNARKKSDILFAIENNIFIVADSYEEILTINSHSSKYNKKVRLGIRLNLDLRDDHVWHGSSINNKFGVSLNYIGKIINILLANKNLVFEGLHLHVGSQIANDNHYIKPIEKYLLVLKKFVNRGLRPKSINLGGGYPETYKYSDTECTTNKEYLTHSFNLSELGNHISTEINRAFNFKPKLIVETGRFLTASCGVLLTEICTIKKTNKITWVGLDGGCNLLPDIWTYDWSFECIPLNFFSDSGSIWGRYNLSGPLCDSGDVLKIGVNLPRLHVGDFLLFLKIGAYQEVQKSNFNIFDNSNTVFIDKNNQTHKII